MADSDPSRPDLLARAAEAQAQGNTLREQLAELAEAIAQVELDVARVQEGIAAQGGSLAALARAHGQRALEFAAREHAEAERWRKVGRAEDRRPEQADRLEGEAQ